MIRDMLQKLQETQSQEAKKHEWCQTEMEKSTKSKQSKQQMLDKLNNRRDQMDAELEQVTQDLATTAKDSEDLKESTRVATEVRTEEKARAAASLTQYKDAQALLKTAVAVLKKFYDQTGGGVPAGTEASVDGSKEGEHKSKAGLGGGVIGLLEIALQDFADLEEETTQSEATGAQQYKELMNESEVRAAVLAKDVEHRTRRKVRLESDRMRANSDISSYEKELQAVETYLKELKGACIAKADSYEERKARRDKELESLKAAHEYLSGNL